MECKAALEEEQFHFGKAGPTQGRLLLLDRHVQLLVRHATFAGEMIAQQIGTARRKNSPDFSMQPDCVTCVPKFSETKRSKISVRQGRFSMAGLPTRVPRT